MAQAAATLADVGRVPAKRVCRDPSRSPMKSSRRPRRAGAAHVSELIELEASKAAEQKDSSPLHQ